MPKQLILNRRNLNLWLFIIVILLAAIIYFSEEQSTLLERLSDTNVDSIHTIKIQHNQNQISLNTTAKSKTGENIWQITRPIKVAANTFRVNSLLQLLNAPVHNKYTLAEIDSKEIGLDNSKTSIQFNHKVITFGITNPVTNLRFIKLDNTVYTIEDVYSPLISSHFGALVSLNLLPPNSTITKLVLRNQTISKDEAGRWQSNIGMSADRVASTVQHWLHDQAFGIHQYLPRKELGEMFVYTSNSVQPIRFLITDIEPWLIIARPEMGLEYHLDIKAYDKLISPTDSNPKNREPSIKH